MSLDISEVRSVLLRDVCPLPYRQQRLLLECLSLGRFQLSLLRSTANSYRVSVCFVFMSSIACSLLDGSLSFGRIHFNAFFARTHELLQYPFRTVALAFEYDKACFHVGRRRELSIANTLPLIVIVLVFFRREFSAGVWKL